MHTVAILALDHVVPFDLSVPLEVFGRARTASGRPLYKVKVCSLRPQVDAGTFILKAPHRLVALRTADTIVIPGVADVSKPFPSSVLDALRKAHTRGARLASVCSGAFILAATGLLDGKRATTHWAAARALTAMYPAIEVDPAVLYVDLGRLLTSAGAAAGLDLCLHLVRRDFGAGVAADTARLSVMPLERTGGQAQFIVDPPVPSDASTLEPLLRWIDAHLAQPLNLDSLARRAAMSQRTLSRRFHEQTGTTPAQYVLNARLRRAQQLLESTNHSIERVASLAGLASTSTFRARFHGLVGTSPVAWRRSFRSP